MHERLYRSTEIGSVDLSAYLKEVCDDLQAVTNHNTVTFEAHDPIPMGTDRAVLVALLMGELVTNASKHAYPASAAGRIDVRVAPASDGSVLLTVRDEGKGLPQDFDPENGGLGMKIISAFVRQSNAKLEIRRLTQGSEFRVEISRQ